MAADTVRLYAKLANVLWRIGRHDETAAAFRAALELGGSVDALQRAHLHPRLGRLELSNTGSRRPRRTSTPPRRSWATIPAGWTTPRSTSGWR